MCKFTSKDKINVFLKKKSFSLSQPLLIFIVKFFKNLVIFVLMQTVVFRECEPFLLSDFTYKKNPYTSNFKKWLPQVKQMQTQKFRYRNLCVRRTLFKTSSSISCITKMLQMSCKTSATPPSVPPTYKKKPFAHFPYKEIQRRGGPGEAWWFFISQLLECAALHIVYQGGKLQRMHE